MSNRNSSHWRRQNVELRAAGFDPAEVVSRKAIVTVAAAYTNAHRCNNRVQDVAQVIIDALDEQGGQGLIVGAPAVSDALTQGTVNAGYSLVSRDLMADCIETGHHAHHGEAMIVVSGCDKTGAAAMMPLARTNACGLVVYPGTSTPGCVDFGPWKDKGNNLTILDYVEARAACEANRITKQELADIEAQVMPGSGTCGAMFTANTMSTIAESIGMMLPQGASHPADYGAGTEIHDDVKVQAQASVSALFNLMHNGITSRDIMTKRAFENAIVTAYAMGGSTNMYLHLLALAREAEVDLDIREMAAIGERVPLIGNLQPHGPYAMVSLHAIGGVPIVMKELLDNGFLHGDVITATGCTLAENLADVKSLDALGDQDVVRPVSEPLSPPGNHISVLTGNLAPESCVLKLSGKTLEDGEFRGRARVFESEEDTMEALRADHIVPGDVIVVRNVGPMGAPGMPEMVMLTIQLQGRGLGKDVALITDGRFSGVSHGILIGHICPEASRGGPLAAVCEGDTIIINPEDKTLTLDISEQEMRERLSTWRPPVDKTHIPRNSVLRKYARLVSSAEHGCVLGN